MARLAAKRYCQDDSHDMDSDDMSDMTIEDQVTCLRKRMKRLEEHVFGGGSHPRPSISRDRHGDDAGGGGGGPSLDDLVLVASESLRRLFSVCPRCSLNVVSEKRISQTLGDCKDALAFQKEKRTLPFRHKTTKLMGRCQNANPKKGETHTPNLLITRRVVL